MQITVDDEDGRLKPRLDLYLTDKLEDLTRSRLQKLIESGAVLVNATAATKSGTKLRAGDVIEVNVPEPVPLEAMAEDIPLDIVFEDENLLVINKPAGMVVHPGAGVERGTLVNAVLHHAGGSLSSIGGVIRPGIVHRLDKDTSGLIMVAKNDLAHNHLAAQLKDKSAGRTYLALLEGAAATSNGIVDLPIGRHPNKRTQMTVVKPGQEKTILARQAVTHYQVLETVILPGRGNCTLMSLELKTGRTHQIRVHMSYLGLPVVGDLVYNTKTTGSLAARQKLGLIGQALHAHKLRFTHPVTGKLLEFTAALPNDFSSLIKKP